MNILIISPFFPPQNSIAGQRPLSWARYWTEWGHDVTVLTTPKEAPFDSAASNGFRVIEIGPPTWYGWLWQVYRLVFPKRTAGVETRDNSSVPSTRYARFGSLRNTLFRLNSLRQELGILGEARMPSFADLWIGPALNWMSGHQPWDLVVSTSWPYATHVLGYLARKKGWVRSWTADFRDLWVGNHISQGILPFRWVESWLENRLLRRADSITTVSPPLADYLSTHHRTTVSVVENGFEPQELEKLAPETAFPDDGRIRMVYAGTIYPGKRDPTPLFQVIKGMTADSAHRDRLYNLEVVFVGQNVDSVKSLAETYGIQSVVKCPGLVARETALRMQRDATVLLFLEDTSHNVEGIFTGKLFEYFASRTQFWAIGVESESELGRLIDNSGCGISLGKSAKRIRQRLEALLSCSVKPMVEPASDLLERYSRKTLARKMLVATTAGLAGRSQSG